jgi:O-antigen/teichoic acid export membrane protein
MKKILLAMSYGTYGLCCLAILYWLGVGAVKVVTESETFGEALGMVALGACTVSCLVILGILILGLIEMTFGNKDSKVNKMVEEILPF